VPTEHQQSTAVAAAVHGADPPLELDGAPRPRWVITTRHLHGALARITGVLVEVDAAGWDLADAHGS
jgi:hypothetical protein